MWEETAPPKGTVFNYPTYGVHQAKPHIACFPAPPEMAVQIYNRGLMPTMFLLLFPGGGGEFYIDYHAGFEGEESVPPLEPGLYRVRAEANGHECVAVTSFWVRA